MKKVVLLVVLMVVLSSFSYALGDTSDNCAGFWGSIGCFLWGDADRCNWASTDYAAARSV